MSHQRNRGGGKYNDETRSHSFFTRTFKIDEIFGISDGGTLLGYGSHGSSQRD